MATNSPYDGSLRTEAEKGTNVGTYDPAMRTEAEKELSGPKTISGTVASAASSVAGTVTQIDRPPTTINTNPLLTSTGQFSNLGSVTQNFATDPWGDTTGVEFEDDSAVVTGAGQQFTQVNGVDLPGNVSWQYRVYVKKNAVGRATAFPGWSLFCIGDVDPNRQIRVNIDTNTGDVNLDIDAYGDTIVEAHSVDSNWWLLTVTCISPSDGTELQVQILPVAGTSATWVWGGTGVGTNVFAPQIRNADGYDSAGFITVADQLASASSSVAGTVTVVPLLSIISGTVASAASSVAGTVDAFKTISGTVASAGSSVAGTVIRAVKVNPNLFKVVDQFSQTNPPDASGSHPFYTTDLIGPNGASDAVEIDDILSLTEVYTRFHNLRIGTAAPYYWEFYLKKDAVGRATRFPGFSCIQTGYTVEFEVDTNTGEWNVSLDEPGDSLVEVISVNASWWKVRVDVLTPHPTFEYFQAQMWPAAGTSATWVRSVTGTGSIIVAPQIKGDELGYNNDNYIAGHTGQRTQQIEAQSASAAGAVEVAHTISGTVASGTSSVAGAVEVAHTISGTVAAQSASVAGTLATTSPITGTTTGTFTCTSILTGVGVLTGSTSVVFTPVSVLTGVGVLTGTTAGTFTCTSTLTAASAPHTISGTVAAQASSLSHIVSAADFDGIYRLFIVGGSTPQDGSTTTSNAFYLGGIIPSSRRTWPFAHFLNDVDSGNAGYVELPYSDGGSPASKTVSISVEIPDDNNTIGKMLEVVITGGSYSNIQLSFDSATGAFSFDNPNSGINATGTTSYSNPVAIRTTFATTAVIQANITITVPSDVTALDARLYPSYSATVGGALDVTQTSSCPVEKFHWYSHDYQVESASVAGTVAVTVSTPITGSTTGTFTCTSTLTEAAATRTISGTVAAQSSSMSHKVTTPGFDGVYVVHTISGGTTDRSGSITGTGTTITYNFYPDRDGFLAKAHYANDGFNNFTRYMQQTYSGSPAGKKVELKVWCIADSVTEIKALEIVFTGGSYDPVRLNFEVVAPYGQHVSNPSGLNATGLASQVSWPTRAYTGSTSVVTASIVVDVPSDVTSLEGRLYPSFDTSLTGDGDVLATGSVRWEEWFFQDITMGASAASVAGTVDATANPAIVGSTSIVFTPTATLTGNGDISGSTTGTFSPTATLTGIGNITGATTATFAPTATLTGIGSVTGSTTGTFSPTATLTGIGSITGSTTATFAPTSILTGVGKLLGTSAAAFALAASITGIGVLTASTTGIFTPNSLISDANAALTPIAGSTSITFTPTSGLTGIGSILGSTDIVFTPASSLAGIGGLTGATSGTFTPTAAIDGIGVLDVATSGTFSPTATLTGIGSLDVSSAIVFSPTSLISDANAALTPISGSTAVIFSPTATLTGIGALSGATSAVFAPVSTVSGIGSLDVATSGTFTPTAALDGVGVLTGATSGTFTPTATLTGIGSLDVTSDIVFTTTGLISDAGSALTPIAGSTAITFSPSSGLTGIGRLTGSTTGTFASVSTLTGRGILAGSATGTFSLTSTLNAVAPITGSTSGTFTPTLALTGTGVLDVSTTGTFTPASGLTGIGSIAGSTTGVFSPTGTLVAVTSISGSTAITFTPTSSLIAVTAITGSTAATFSPSSTLTGIGALDVTTGGTFTLTSVLAGPASLNVSSNIVFTTAGRITRFGEDLYQPLNELTVYTDAELVVYIDTPLDVYIKDEYQVLS